MSRRNIPLAGRFDCWHQPFDLPDLLLAVCRTGKTGHLLMENGEAEKTVVVHKGEVIFAKSSSVDDRLGPHLLKTKRIRFDHLTELSRFISPTKRFGAVLVENGVLSPKDLVQGVIEQVRTIVLSLFSWTEAAYAFEERELEKETITLTIPIAKLITDGVRIVGSWRRVTGGLGSLDAVYQTTDEIEELAEKVKLDASASKLLADLRGPKTIAEACIESDLSDFEVCQLLWAFRALDWIAPMTERAPVLSPATTPTPTPAPAPAAESTPVVEATVIEAEPADEIEADSDGIGMVLGNGES